jgi:hypothetical protein
LEKENQALKADLLDAENKAHEFPLSETTSSSFPTSQFANVLDPSLALRQFFGLGTPANTQTGSSTSDAVGN